MLEPVVEKVDIHSIAIFRQPPAPVAVSTNHNRDFRKRLGQPRRLVSHLPRVSLPFRGGIQGDDLGGILPAVTSGEDARAKAAGKKPPGGVGHQRSLTRPARRNIPHAHYRLTQPAGLEPAARTGDASQGDAKPESRGQGHQEAIQDVASFILA